MIHTTVRQAIIQSRRSGQERLTRSLRNALLVSGFEVIDLSCLGKQAEAIHDPLTPPDNYLYEPMTLALSAAGFEIINPDCLFEYCKKIHDV